MHITDRQTKALPISYSCFYLQVTKELNYYNLAAYTSEVHKKRNFDVSLKHVAEFRASASRVLPAKPVFLVFSLFLAFS